jgi:hypothetical protein
MNWFLLLIAFSLAVFMGAAATSLFARLRPQWSDRRRLLISAALLPGITMAGTAAIILAVLLGDPGGEANMRDLAIAALAKLGALLALLALVGGLVGATLRQSGTRR